MIPVRHRVLPALLAAALILSTGCSKNEPPAPQPVDEAPTAAATPPAAPTAEPVPVIAPPAVPETEASTSDAPTAPAASTPASDATAPSAAAAEPEPWRSLAQEVQTPAARPPAAAPSADSAAAPEQPESAVVQAPPAEASGAVVTAAKVDGSQIAQGVCIACHQAGINGAPKFANKVAWAPRIAQGREKLYQNSIKGFRGMPPRGGNPSLTDEQVRAAVDYLVATAGGYKE